MQHCYTLCWRRWRLKPWFKNKSYSCWFMNSRGVWLLWELHYVCLWPMSFEKRTRRWAGAGLRRRRLWDEECLRWCRRRRSQWCGGHARPHRVMHAQHYPSERGSRPYIIGRWHLTHEKSTHSPGPHSPRQQKKQPRNGNKSSLSLLLRCTEAQICGRESPKVFEFPLHEHCIGYPNRETWVLTTAYLTVGSALFLGKYIFIESPDLYD